MNVYDDMPLGLLEFIFKNRHTQIPRHKRKELMSAMSKKYIDRNIFHVNHRTKICGSKVNEL